MIYFLKSRNLDSFILNLCYLVDSIYSGCTTGLTMFRLHIFRTLKLYQSRGAAVAGSGGGCFRLCGHSQCVTILWQSPVGPDTVNISASSLPQIASHLQHLKHIHFKPGLKLSGTRKQFEKRPNGRSPGISHLKSGSILLHDIPFVFECFLISQPLIFQITQLI